MWSKLDDALLTNPKVLIAGDLLGKNGPGMVQGMFSLGLMYANKHGTDGHLAKSVVKSFVSHFAEPLKVADALVSGGLWEKASGGYQIHDFLDHNFKAEDVQSGRIERAEIKARAGRIGGLKSGRTRRRRAEEKKATKHEAEHEAEMKQAASIREA